MAVAGVPMWVVSILKGGARKTTTAVLTTIGLTQRGIDVLLVDADSGTQGVGDWMTTAHARGHDLPCHVTQWNPSNGSLIVPFIADKVRQTGAQHVIVDIGGEAPSALEQLVIAADRVISPTGAERGELGRLRATKALVAAADVPMSVLLTRVPIVAGGRSATARTQLTAGGMSVLETEIKQDRETYADVWGTVPDKIGAYDQLVTELLSMENGS